MTPINKKQAELYTAQGLIENGCEGPTHSVSRPVNVSQMIEDDHNKPTTAIYNRRANDLQPPPTTTPQEKIYRGEGLSRTLRCSGTGTTDAEKCDAQGRGTRSTVEYQSNLSRF